MKLSALLLLRNGLIYHGTTALAAFAVTTRSGVLMVGHRMGCLKQSLPFGVSLILRLSAAKKNQTIRVGTRREIIYDHEMGA